MNRQVTRKRSYHISQRHKNRLIHKQLKNASRSDPSLSILLSENSHDAIVQLQSNISQPTNTSHDDCSAESQSRISNPDVMDSDDQSDLNPCLGLYTVPNQPNILDNDSDTGSSKTSVLEKEREELQSDLASWAINHQLTNVSVNSLLKILRKHSCHEFLPQDARTLKNTPRNQSSLKIMLPGTYLHFGLEHNLKQILKDLEVLPQCFNLMINIDGLPLSKSSNSQFWPILARVTTIPGSKPFAIGVYHGPQKPNDCNEFLQDCVNEARQVCTDGIKHNHLTIQVKIVGLICDAPARAFVTGIKGHTGYFGCGKCTQEGEYLQSRMCFPDTRVTLRTDENFKNFELDDHHTKKSIIESLPEFGMVSQVPFEYMHLACLGVMRKLLNCWIKGKDHAVRVRYSKVAEASKSLESLKPYICSEFARIPRSLKDLDRWKATEFRQLLLYTGPIVLLSMLSEQFYDHFLCLHCAMRILASTDLAIELNDYAHSLLKYFISIFETLYGRHLISYNVHGLLHISRDVLEFGPLDNFSTFPFENQLQAIKKLLKKCDRPLQQLGNRLKEMENIKSNPRKTKESSPKEKSIGSFTLVGPHTSGPLIHGCKRQYNSVYIGDFLISCKDKDNCVILRDKSIAVVYNISVYESRPVIIGRKFHNVEDAFTSPCESSKVGIFLVDSLSELKMWYLEEIKAKALKIKKSSKFFISQLLHCPESGI